MKIKAKELMFLIVLIIISGIFLSCTPRGSLHKQCSNFCLKQRGDAYFTTNYSPHNNNCKCFNKVGDMTIGLTRNEMEQLSSKMKVNGKTRD